MSGSLPRPGTPTRSVTSARAPRTSRGGGFAVIESSLWEAVPAAMRDLDRCHGRTLPPDVMPFAFASWMGGDRDGNPSVTASVTREVRLLARWMAADLFLRDVTTLSAALSMSACTPALRDRAGDASEPYRAVLRVLRDRLLETRSWAERGWSAWTRHHSGRGGSPGTAQALLRVAERGGVAAHRGRAVARHPQAHALFRRASRRHRRPPTRRAPHRGFRRVDPLSLSRSSRRQLFHVVRGGAGASGCSSNSPVGGHCSRSTGPQARK